MKFQHRKKNNSIKQEKKTEIFVFILNAGEQKKTKCLLIDHRVLFSLHFV